MNRYRNLLACGLLGLALFVTGCASGSYTDSAGETHSCQTTTDKFGAPAAAATGGGFLGMAFGGAGRIGALAGMAVGAGAGAAANVFIDDCDDLEAEDKARQNTAPETGDQGSLPTVEEDLDAIAANQKVPVS